VARYRGGGRVELRSTRSATFTCEKPTLRITSLQLNVSGRARALTARRLATTTEGTNMKAIRRFSAPVALALVSITGACGSSEKDTNPGDKASGGSLPASGGSLSASGGASASGTTSQATGGAPFPFGGFAGTGGTLSKAECLDQHFSDPKLDSACKDCMCECNPTAAAACGDSCWQLSRCVQSSCAGVSTDFACVASACSSFLSGALSAASVASCFSRCRVECGSWFVSGGAGGAASGGAPTAATGGASPSGGAPSEGGRAGSGGSLPATDAGNAGTSSNPAGAGGAGY
jgi:hypothetical protein